MGLPTYGLLDRATLDALGIAGAVEPPWLAKARSQIGRARNRRPSAQSDRHGYVRRAGAKLLGIDGSDEETAWCGTFAAYCLLETLPAEPLPPIAVRVRPFGTFGVGLPLAHVAIGAVALFARPGGGHAGFVAGRDRDSLHIFGGDQGNSVSITWIWKDRLTALRWLSTVARLKGLVPPFTTMAGSLSRNEA